MLIKDMFAKQINRDIKGVIKVGQADDENIKQELEEYVVTRELQRHFADFFSSYSKGISGNTDKMGVWISGFFGSGKSHFLKILSYMLENKTVDGKTALDYFIEDNKIVDQTVLGNMKLAANTSTDVILFNIDSKSNKTTENNLKEDILSVMLKVFNQHLGYYGGNPMLADLERTLEEEDLYEEFKETFLRLKGKTWMDERHKFRSNQDFICDTLVEMKYMTIEAARNLCESIVIGNYNLDISTFAEMVQKHIDEKGNNHHVVFLVDEMGQYIGDRTDIMLNLQTLTEDLGTACKGKAWIVVTSQQDIDSVTNVKGDDFSKIQGRFDTRLALSSTDVSEVIKKRILEKTETASQNLRLLFEEKEVVVKNLIMWTDGVEKKLYKDKNDFVEIYPFIPYQFNLLGDVLTSIRTHGASGKHLAEGERSMLSLFRESAMSIMNEGDKNLIPFSTFYNALEQFLDHSHRIVIQRAMDNDYLNPNKESYCFDVEVLKTLFMIKYLEGAITSNIENVTSLMVTNIDEDRLALKEKVESALKRLCTQNYTQRSGDIYVFLSNEEQEINREIENQPVELFEINNKVSELIFDGIYDEKKYRHTDFNGRYSFGFNQIVDDRSYKNNQNFDINLRIITPDFDGTMDDATLRMMSGQSSSVLVVLPNDRAFIDDIRSALKINKYLAPGKTSNATKYEQIKDAKRKEMRDRNNDARIFLEEALKNADIYANGNKLKIGSKDIKARINEGLGKLVSTVYYKLSYIDTPMNEANVRAVLKGKQAEQITLDTTEFAFNNLALQDLQNYVEENTRKHAKTSMKSIKERFLKAPYGFIEDDIEWLVARLFKDGDITFFVNGEVITLLSKSEDEVYRYMNRREFSEKLLLETREKANDKQKKIAKNLMQELFGAANVESDDDSVLNYFNQCSSNLKIDLDKLEIEYRNQPKYPGLQIIKQGRELLTDILRIKYSVEFFRYVEEKEDCYLDFAEDFEPIKAFFAGEQKEIWDKTIKLVNIYEQSKTFIVSDEIEDIIISITTIIQNPNPYREIRLLPELIDKYAKLYAELLTELEKPILVAIEEARLRTMEVLEGKECKTSLEDKVLDGFEKLKTKAQNSNSIATLQNIKIEADALKVRLINEINKLEENIMSEQARKIAEEEAEYSTDETDITVPIEPIKSIKNQKTVSIKTVIHENTWRIETTEDVDRYIEKLRAKLKENIKDDTILNIEF